MFRDLFLFEFVFLFFLSFFLMNSLYDVWLVGFELKISLALLVFQVSAAMISQPCVHGFLLDTVVNDPRTKTAYLKFDKPVTKVTVSDLFARLFSNTVA